MSEPSANSPFIKSHPIYAIATKQNFAYEVIQFKPIIEVLEMLSRNIAFGNFFLNVIDFRDYTYPYTSPNVESVMGYKRELVTNVEWFSQVIHPGDYKNFMDGIAVALEYIQALPYEQKKKMMINACFRVMHGTRNEYVWLYQQCHMSYIDKNGALVYLITLLTDVSHLMAKQEGCSWSVTERTEDGSNYHHIGSEKKLPDSKTLKPLLTVREREIVNLSARGFNAREIAQQLKISYQTILTHKKKILKKTNSRNMPEAVSYALNLGYL